MLRVWHIIGAIRTGFIGKTSGIFISHVLTKIQQANGFLQVNYIIKIGVSLSILTINCLEIYICLLHVGGYL